MKSSPNAGSSPNSNRRLVWVSTDGTNYLLSEMATPHIFNCVRMIFNHTMPPAHRIEGGNPYNLCLELDECLMWMEAMLEELSKRDNLTAYHIEQIQNMRRNAAWLKVGKTLIIPKRPPLGRKRIEPF